ncbi:CUGBP Elav-like family member 2 isoform X1 [Arapaima gigas]
MVSILSDLDPLKSWNVLRQDAGELTGTLQRSGDTLTNGVASMPGTSAETAAAINVPAEVGGFARGQLLPIHDPDPWRPEWQVDAGVPDVSRVHRPCGGTAGDPGFTCQVDTKVPGGVVTGDRECDRPKGVCMEAQHWAQLSDFCRLVWFVPTAEGHVLLLHGL